MGHGRTHSLRGYVRQAQCRRHGRQPRRRRHVRADLGTPAAAARRPLLTQMNRQAWIEALPVPNPLDFQKWACRDDPHARYRATLLQALTPNALRDAVRAQSYYTCHCARRRRTLSALDGAHNRRVGCTSSCDRHTHCNGYRVGTGRVGTQVTANPDATHVWLSLGGNDGIARLGIGLRP